MSSLSATCSRDRLANATGRVYRCWSDSTIERPHEIVPRAEQREHAQRDDDRLQRRYDDRAEDAKLARAVDARGVEEVVGNCEGILTNEEDAEDRCHRGHDDAAVSVDEPQLLEEQEQRDHRDLRRNHECSQHEPKDALAALEAQLRECIACRDVERERKRRHRDGEQHAVQEVARHAGMREQLPVVGKRRISWNERRRIGACLAGRHERHGDHPHERKERYRSEAEQRAVHGPLCGRRVTSALALMRRRRVAARAKAARRSRRRSTGTAGTRPPKRCRGSTT